MPVGRPKGSKSKGRKGRFFRKMTPSKRLLGPNTVYTFQRWASNITGTTSSTSPNMKMTLNAGGSAVSYALKMQLANLPNAIDFQNLFDLYKIDKVEYRFSLIQNPDNTQSSVLVTDPYYPRMWYVYDPDDEGVITLDAIRERQGAKYRVLEPNKMIKLSVIPKFQALNYKTSTSEGFRPSTGYLDIQDTDIPHYGLKVVIDFNGNNAQRTYDVICQARYTISCKGPQ